MPNKPFVTGQYISPELKARARELRQEMTPAETKLWQRLRANRLGGFHFRRQQIIGSYIVDFYCHAVSLVVEVDGGIHLAQQADDHQRDLYLNNLGLTVLRFTNEQVEHKTDQVISTILEACISQNQDQSRLA